MAINVLTVRRLTPFALLLMLAGCGGGGDGGEAAAAPPGGGATQTTVATTSPTVTKDLFTSAGAASLAYVTGFDEAAASAVRGSTEFEAQKRNVKIGGSTYSSFSFADIRAEYALSTGLTGAGQTIAIVDDGFRVSHAELDGKVLKSFGNPGVESHGTAVAALAAGKRDGSGMMGVAPGANLHLSTFMDGFSALAAATRDAEAVGAVVQNNSWGYKIPVTDIQASLAANPGWSVEQALQNSLGGSATEIRSYLDALGSFTRRGVVVFAAANDKAATSSTVMDGLPVVAPELGAGWLVAISAIAKFDNGRIVSADRMSAGCLQMAHTCLAANGVVYSATAASDTAYGLWNGTSFAAPQIAAGVALLAEAFPGLPANDIRRRLLATADNGFFTPTAWSDFGNGVVHGYNAEFGHGFMDLRAALLPIGATGLPATNSAYGGVTPLGSTYVSGGEAQGDAVVRALAGETIAVFDSLGAGFRAPALAIYGTSARSTFAPRLRSFAAGNTGRPAAASLSYAGENGTGGWSLHAGESGSVLEQLGLSAATTPLVTGAGNLAGLAHDALSFGMSRDMGGGSSFSFYAFSGMRPESPDWPEGLAPGLSRLHPEEDVSVTSGGGFAWSRPLGAATVTFGASFLSEPEGMLGMRSVGPGQSAKGLSGALDLGLAVPLAATGARIAFSAQVGTGDGSGDGLLRGTQGAVFSAFGVSLQKESAFRDGDQIRLFARQPLRLESGNALLRVPEGRTVGGEVVWRDLSVDLAPSARQIDLGFEYATPVGRQSRFKIGAAYAHNDGHVRDSSGVSLMGAFQRTF